MLFVLLFFGVVLLPAPPSPFLWLCCFPASYFGSGEAFPASPLGWGCSLPPFLGWCCFAFLQYLFTYLPRCFVLFFFSRFVLVFAFPSSFRSIVSSFCCIVLRFTSCVAQRAKELRSGNTSDAFTEKVALTGPSTFAPWKQSFASAVAGKMVGLTPRESAGVVMPRPSVETSRTE